MQDTLKVYGKPECQRVVSKMNKTEDTNQRSRNPKTRSTAIPLAENAETRRHGEKKPSHNNQQPIAHGGTVQTKSRFLSFLRERMAVEISFCHKKKLKISVQRARRATEWEPGFSSFCELYCYLFVVFCVLCVCNIPLLTVADF